MNWSSTILILWTVLFLGCNETKKSVQSASKTSEVEVADSPVSKYLIEAEDLLPLLNDDRIKIIDFRKEKEYRKGHIDGAINIWRAHIEDTSLPFKGMMAKPDSIASLLGGLGMSNDDILIVYDDRGSCDAARFWWVMQNLDFEHVKILNGGLKAWSKVGGTVNKNEVTLEKARFQLPKAPSYRYLIGKSQLQQEVSAGTPLLIDTRTHDEYSGKRQKAGASLGGRIPGSHWIDWTEAIDYHGSLKIKPKVELEKIYEKWNIAKDYPIVTYCHTGVRSAHTTFVLTQLLGFKNVKNYDGSWTEWSYYNDQPMERDSLTTILK